MLHPPLVTPGLSVQDPGGEETHKSVPAHQTHKIKVLSRLGQANRRTRIASSPGVSTVNIRIFVLRAF